MEELTVKQQMLSARFRHLLPKFIGPEPELAVVEETTEVLRQIGDGDLESAAQAVQRMFLENESPDPQVSGVANAISSMFVEGLIDIAGVSDDCRLVWAPTDTWVEKKADD
ncbi:hypothetical protein N9C85_01570 [Synechococcus sp. AH-224-I15]|nr:hypothetical protein [Synechococcus sp. AH-224-I15]